ncbi:MAG: hypothetical protein ACYCQJ_05340 [Nitrososphaerales archaeon]
MPSTNQASKSVSSQTDVTVNCPCLSCKQEREIPERVREFRRAINLRASLLNANCNSGECD